MKKVYFILIIVVLALLVGASWWSKPNVSDDSALISPNGIHWHPELTIFVKGEKVGIPGEIGLGGVHRPIHTHSADSGEGILHLEFTGVVLEKDIALSQFFNGWGKDMRSFGTLTKMVVNGEENTEFENYIMRDADKIELHYE